MYEGFEMNSHCITCNVDTEFLSIHLQSDIHKKRTIQYWKNFKNEKKIQQKIQ